MTDLKLDERISGLVRRVALDVPEGLDDRALTAARAGARTDAGRDMRRPLGLKLWAALAPAAVLAGLAALLVLPSFRTPAAAPISEIRTEIELADKNIKIIFFQKPDFNLFKETNHD